MTKLEDYEVKAVTRKQYLTELMMWFEDNLDLVSVTIIF